MKPKGAKKISISILIEDNKLATAEFYEDEPLQAVVNYAIDQFKITTENRRLKREDGTPLKDLSVKIYDADQGGIEGVKGIYPKEVLRFFPIVTKPNRDKGWATVENSVNSET